MRMQEAVVNLKRKIHAQMPVCDSKVAFELFEPLIDFRRLMDWSIEDIIIELLPESQE